MDESSDKALSTEILTFDVEEKDAGSRLDAYLASRIEGWSRARLQRLIDDEDVLVNLKPTKPSYRIQTNDQIEIELTQHPLNSFTPENIPVEIVFEDEDIVVVNKPAHMVVHPAAGVNSGTLANALAYHLEQLSKRAGVIRPGIVHRLDKDTSGLMVVAKTEAAHENLANQFREREVFKSYVALVHGVVRADAGRIEEPLGRDPHNRTRMAVVRSGRSALTLYRVRRRYDGFTLLDVELKTGRTHQIRVHLSWLKHPVVADEVYGGGRDNTVRDVVIRSEIRKLDRQFLHAERLAFKHPATSERIEFKSELPSELRHLLNVLDQKATQ